MDEQMKSARFRLVRTILEKDNEFCQMRTDYRHRVIWDIVHRYTGMESYWSDLGEFVHNYASWVDLYISDLTDDTQSLWEKWAEMLQKLYLG